MDDQEWLEQHVTNDPAMVEFLAETLASFMAVNRKNRQPWTKKRIAVQTEAEPKIDGKVDDTTLGRFLDPEYEQDPSPSTTRKIAHFLLLEDAITRRDLELHAASLDVRLATAIGGLGGGTDSRTHEAFLQSLHGIYLGQSYSNGFLLFTRLALIHRKDANALLADEIQRLYRVEDGTPLRDWQAGLERGELTSPDRAVSASGGREIESFVSSGFVVAGTELGVVLLRASARGYSGALNLTAIEFDDDDDIRGLLSTRNSGWSVKPLDDIVVPTVIGPETPPRNIVKYMAEDGRFLKQNNEEIRKIQEIDKKEENNIEDKDGLGFVDLNSSYVNEIDIEELSEENLRDKTPNEKLELALKWSDLDLFGEALGSGADANLVPEGFENPLVFILAKDGKDEWVDMLLETGRCDLTKVDGNGLAASYYLAVTARTFAATRGAPDEVRRFGRLAKQLREERSRQLGAASVADPSPS